MPEPVPPLDEFVCAVYELAAADSVRGWLAALSGDLSGPSPTGRWEAVLERVPTGPPGRLLIAGSAAAVVGSAAGVWRAHVEHTCTRLAIAAHGVETSDAVEVARAASDIDAARLQITAAASDEHAGTAPFVQAVGRARGAADRLLAAGRHALDASDPVAGRWRDLHAGCRLAARILR